jgi:hypothetical protein
VSISREAVSQSNSSASFTLSCSGVKKVLAVGERLSPCGKFAINSAGEWRELAGKDQVAKTPEMAAVDAEGKHIVQELK